ncbi:MAG TPA: hypothetical protein GXZ58_11255 [Bacilli bacterium]|uniref:Uncharacterized protein n=1 Tax=Amphibacillus indicireducens TaxID=1076330 RepID=A0ABP7V5W7_9BACI|nr:hypothetical protein [Bacilli bacterium]
MGWRSIELQVALPRTQDVGRIQEQIQQRGQFMQEVIAQAQQQAEEMKRRSVTNLEEGHKLSNDTKESDQENQLDQSNEHADSKPEHKIKIQHPYLGTRIDING